MSTKEKSNSERHINFTHIDKHHGENKNHGKALFIGPLRGKSLSLARSKFSKYSRPPKPWQLPVQIWKQRAEQEQKKRNAERLNKYSITCQIEHACNRNESREELQKNFSHLIHSDLCMDDEIHSQETKAAIALASQRSLSLPSSPITASTCLSTSPPSSSMPKNHSQRPSLIQTQINKSSSYPVMTSLITPRLTRHYNNKGVDRVRKIWADEKNQYLRRTSLDVCKAPILSKLRHSIPQLKEHKDIATTSCLADDANGSNTNTVLLSPRAAKSFKRSLDLQADLVNGLKAAQAAALYKRKLLTATLLLQRIARGMISRNGFALAVKAKMDIQRDAEVDAEVNKMYDSATYFDARSYGVAIEDSVQHKHTKATENAILNKDNNKEDKVAGGSTHKKTILDNENTALSMAQEKLASISGRRERLRRQERALYISSYRVPNASSNTSSASCGGYKYALQIIEQKATQTLKKTYKKLNKDEELRWIKKVQKDVENKLVMEKQLVKLDWRLCKFNVRQSSERKLKELQEKHAKMAKLAKNGGTQAKITMRQLRSEYDSFKRVLSFAKVGQKFSDDKLKNIESEDVGHVATEALETHKIVHGDHNSYGKVQSVYQNQRNDANGSQGTHHRLNYYSGQKEYMNCYVYDNSKSYPAVNFEHDESYKNQSSHYTQQVQKYEEHSKNDTADSQNNYYQNSHNDFSW